METPNGHGKAWYEASPENSDDRAARELGVNPTDSEPIDDFITRITEPGRTTGTSRPMATGSGLYSSGLFGRSSAMPDTTGFGTGFGATTGTGAVPTSTAYDGLLREAEQL